MWHSFLQPSSVTAEIMKIQEHHFIIMILIRRNTALHSTSGVAGPAQRPGIHEVHPAAVPRAQPRCSSQRWRGRGCSYGHSCGSRCGSRTVWSPYLLPETRADSQGWMWWVERTQPPFQEVSRRWASSSSRWSMTLESTTGPRIVIGVVMCSNV